MRAHLASQITTIFSKPPPPPPPKRRKGASKGAAKGKGKGKGKGKSKGATAKGKSKGEGAERSSQGSGFALRHQMRAEQLLAFQMARDRSPSHSSPDCLPGACQGAVARIPCSVHH